MKPAHTGGPAAAAGSIGVRVLDDARISYRVATTDEIVLETDYGATRFFPEGYAPPADATILDAGAHIGVFAALVARYVPEGVVHALEPSIENFGLLKKNLHDNAAANVVAHGVALGGTNGTVRLHHAPGSVGHSFYANSAWDGERWDPRPPESPPPAPYEDVACRTLPDFLAGQGIGRVDFLKMNIEGAEYDVLLGSPEETLRAIACMQVELHPEPEGRVDRVIERLQACGFETTFVATDHPAVAGWLTARR